MELAADGDLSEGLSVPVLHYSILTSHSPRMDEPIYSL